MWLLKQSPQSIHKPWTALFFLQIVDKFYFKWRKKKYLEKKYTDKKKIMVAMHLMTGKLA